jgi:hypothetical protein
MRTLYAFYSVLLYLFSIDFIENKIYLKKVSRKQRMLKEDKVFVGDEGKERRLRLP